MVIEPSVRLLVKMLTPTMRQRPAKISPVTHTGIVTVVVILH